MKTVEDIISWILTHQNAIIVGLLVNSLVYLFLSLKRNIPKALKLLKKIMTLKFLKFTLLYVLPVGIIVLMIFDNTTEPTFKNIAFFVIICFTLFLNFVIGHIIELYKMITKLTRINSDKLTEINDIFNSSYKYIEKIKSDNNLK